MRHAVEISPSAAAEAADAHAYIAADSPLKADLWLAGLLSAVDSLERYPRRFPLAPEADSFREEIRQMVYGGYRVLYTVAAGRVRILHIRHAARRPLSPDER